MSNHNQERKFDLNLFKDVINQPRPVAFGTEIAVNISPENSVFSAFVKSFVNSALQELQAQGGSIDLDEETLTNYCHTAIAARCELTANARCSYWHRSDMYLIPAFLGAALGSIGIAEDSTIGIKLFPVYKGDESKLIKDKSELLRISQILAVLERRGMRFADCLPYSREGEIDFLMMEIIEDDVRARNNQAHPAFGMLAAFFNVTGITKVLGAQALRVSYGNVKGFEYQVAKNASPRS